MDREVDGTRLAGRRPAGRSLRRARGRSPVREKEAWGSGFLLAALCVTLFLAPLPLGSNRDWAWPVLGSLIAGLVLLGGIFHLRDASRFATAATDPVVVGLGLWVAYGFVYLVPVVPLIASLLAPEVQLVYEQANRLARSDFPLYLTIDRHLTLQTVLKQAMYASACFLVVLLVTNKSRLKLMLGVLVAAGVVEVSVALGARMLNVDLTPRNLMDGHWDVLRGTFVNRNHFAAFLGMSAAAGLGLTLCYVDRMQSSATLTGRIAAPFRQLNGSALVVIGSVLIIGAGMILSNSRGGVGAFAGAAFLVLVLSWFARGWRGRELFLVWPFAIAGAGAVVWSGFREFAQRILASGVMLEERWVQWSATREMISDFWLTGVGPGAYQRGFTAYKDSALRPLFYDHAHNDYLQLLGEYGAIGALIMTIIVGVVLVRLIRAFTKRGDIVVRGALFASLTGVTAMMIHSLVEFNFQIPANALYFWVLVGVGIAATRVKRAKVRRRSDRRPAADGAGTR